jgi:hypothetical protein
LYYLFVSIFFYCGLFSPLLEARGNALLCLAIVNAPADVATARQGLYTLVMR